MTSNAEAAPRTLLALDVGDARIGVAAGREGSPLAFGRGVIRRGRQRDDVEQVLELAAQEGATRVVVGLPRRTGGGESRQAQRVRAFAQALEQAGLEVVFEDERFTTQLAARQLAGSALPRGKRQQKGRLDEAAAVLILESYLRRQLEPPGVSEPTEASEPGDPAEQLE